MAGLSRILCLHGGGLDARQWRGLRERLLGFDLLSPDLPGHGTRRGERLTLEGALQTALDALDGQPAHVVGHSMGGALALELARRHPALVQSLLVSGTVGPLSPGQARLMAWAVGGPPAAAARPRAEAGAAAVPDSAGGADLGARGPRRHPRPHVAGRPRPADGGPLPA